jgi:hypothetical protein
LFTGVEKFVLLVVLSSLTGSSVSLFLNICKFGFTFSFIS